MDALAILESIENAKGKLAKVEILKDNRDHPELLELLDAALNFKRKFHMKKFETICELTPEELVNNHRTHAGFMDVLNLLENRSITGNDAIQHVEWFFASCNELEIKWYARVLRKNLRCGFDVSSCKKAGINIEVFDVMLAKNGKDYKKAPQLVGQGVYVSPKFDGYRCIALCDHGEVTLYSRNGTEYKNFPKVQEKLATWCIDSSFVLDGEIMSDDFNAMQSLAFGSLSKKATTDSKYHVFGYVSWDEWQSENFQQNTMERLRILGGLFELHKDRDVVVPVMHILTTSMDDILQLEKEYLEQGFEGAMALPCSLPYYKGKKTGRLMKFKTFESQDCKILSIYEGKKNTKYEGMMGGVTVIQEDGQHCDCGSGFSDDERLALWADPAAVIGRTIECAYQEMTPDKIMRFPTKQRWRPDKD